jgi:DNA-binding MarR family transcriptional regulator
VQEHGYEHKGDSAAMKNGLKGRKSRKFDSPAQEVYLSLWRTYDRLRAIEDEVLAEFELTAQQYNVLRLLKAAHPEPVPTLQLSSRLISRAPDITRMLDRLQEKDWVQRLRSEEDRRAVLVAITPKGLELLKTMSDPIKKMHAAQVGHLTAEETETLCDLLASVRAPHEPENSIWNESAD